MTELDLLAIGAHPDDLEISCGGWIALATQRGQTVTMIDLTEGELATNGTVAIRAQEAAAAATLLGVTDRRNLRLPDGGLRATEDGQVDALVEQIRSLRPALLLAPHTEARHPDHAEAGALCRRAAFLAGLPKDESDSAAGDGAAELEEIKRSLHWRDDATEAAWMASKNGQRCRRDSETVPRASCGPWNAQQDAWGNS